MNALATQSEIVNDTGLRKALESLDPLQKRLLGARFVENVSEFTGDKRVRRALDVANNRDASEEELESVFREVKKAMIDSRTRCGADCDWNDQAAHFVARAATAVVAPAGQCQAPDPLWQAVQSCRMARNCALIARDVEDINTEASAQYQIVEQFLAA